MNASIWLRTSLLAGLVLPILGQDAEPSLKVGGFGTLGLVWNDTDQAEFARDTAQPDGVKRDIKGQVDSRLGVQVDGRLADNLRATLQVVSKYRYDGSYRPDVTWAFAGWNPRPEVEFRAGRLGIESFMNADSRDVGYSYLWVRPPVECFGIIPITRMNGVDLTGTFPMGTNATLRLKGFYGSVAQEQVPLEGYPDLDLAGDRILGVIAEAQSLSWRWRLAYARFKIRRGFSSPIGDVPAYLDTFANLLGDPRLRETASAADFKGATLQWYSLGCAYENGPFQVQAMLNHLDSDRLSIPPSWAGFASLGYRVGHLVPYVIWSRITSKRETPYVGDLPTVMLPDASELAWAVQQLADANVCDQSTVSAGLRWDFASSADFKIQVDRVRAKVPGSLWQHVQAGWDGRTTVVTATVDFTF
ncbi:MAG TPA: hypothetical protein VN436_06050 [Holophaga sp.]|nr:hypothetical protein [Holophaga sp.]